MDTPPDSEVMKVSNSANILPGCRLKEPPTRQESSHPENPNLYPRALLESDASTHRSTFDLAGRNKGPATAVTHTHNVPALDNLAVVAAGENVSQCPDAFVVTELEVYNVLTRLNMYKAS